MDIADLLTPGRIVARLPAVSKARLLDDLARRAAAATGLPQPSILEALEFV